LRYTDVSELVLFPIILYVLYPVIMCYDVSSVVLCNFLQYIVENVVQKQHIQTTYSMYQILYISESCQRLYG